jgi:hypothetical protein
MIVELPVDEVVLRGTGSSTINNQVVLRATGSSTINNQVVFRATGSSTIILIVDG